MAHQKATLVLKDGTQIPVMIKERTYRVLETKLDQISFAEKFNVLFFNTNRPFLKIKEKFKLFRKKDKQ